VQRRVGDQNGLCGWVIGGDNHVEQSVAVDGPSIGRGQNVVGAHADDLDIRAGEERRESRGDVARVARRDCDSVDPERSARLGKRERRRRCG